MADQAQRLRALRERPSSIRTIAFTSGKGGVGKSTLVVNLGLVLARQGVRVGILDGDLGLANLDVLLGLTPKHTLRDVIEGDLPLQEIMISGPYGLQVLPASSGIEALANLETDQRERLVAKLSTLDEFVDILLVDTAAGISSTVLSLILSCQEAVVVTAPEPTALTDAYAVLKVVSQRNPRHPVRLLVNMAESQRQAEETYLRIERVAKRFLFSHPTFAGYVVWDPCVSKAVQEQKPLTVYYPYAKATRCIHTLAQSLLALSPAPDGVGGFWDKMASWAGAR
jgi:flagellar biosynthesis protein FlhG